MADKPTLAELDTRDLVALVAFHGLVQAGDPQAGFKAYELADDFIHARTAPKPPSYTAENDDDDLPF